MRESSIEKALVAYAKTRGIYTRKFSSPSHRGVPDRIFVCDGNVLFLELKVPGNKPSPLQQAELDTLNKQGANAGWTDNIEDGKAVLSTLYRASTDGFYHPQSQDFKFLSDAYDF